MNQVELQKKESFDEKLLALFLLSEDYTLLESNEYHKVKSLYLDINKPINRENIAKVEQIIESLTHLNKLQIQISILEIFMNENLSQLTSFIEAAKNVAELSLHIALEDNSPKLSVIGQSLGKFKNLQTLSLSVRSFSEFKNITYDFSQVFVHFKMLQNLQTLQLTVNQAKSCNEIFEQVGEGIKWLAELKKLSLLFQSFDKTNSETTKIVNDMFNQLENISKLKNISVAFSKTESISKELQNKGMMSFFQKQPDLQILEIAIKSFHLGLEGAQNFKEGLQKLQQLTKLKLTLGLTYMGKGYAYVSDGIGYLSKLNYLEIITEDNLGNEYYRYITESVLSLRKLVYLKLKLIYCSDKNVFNRLNRTLRLTQFIKQW